MKTEQELSPAALAAIDKVTKLLALANDKGATQGEAENAMALATRILEQHNLDLALVEANAGSKDAGKRADKKSSGGLYKWQRKVWEHTAKLNMCHYFSIKGLEAGSKYEQRFVGRAENVLATNLMGQYLQDTIERMAAQWAKDQGYASRFVKSAIIFREGMADAICSTLSDARYRRLQEARAREAEQRAAQPAGNGTSIVLASVIQSEEDLNNDYLWGYEPGTTARRRAENQAAWAKQEADGNAKQVAIAVRRLIDPQFDLEMKAQEAAARREQERLEAKWRKLNSRRSYGARETAESRRRNTSEYVQGTHAGRDIRIDQQVGTTSNNARIK
jgi:hypothetical protein